MSSPIKKRRHDRALQAALSTGVLQVSHNDSGLCSITI